MLSAGKRPHPVGEFQRKKPIVLTGGYQSRRLQIKARLGGAMVRAPFRDCRVVQRPRAWRSHRWWHKVSNFSWSHRIAYIKDADAGFEISTRQRSGVLGVVDSAVMTAIRKTRQANKVRKNLVAILRVVHLELQFGSDPWVSFVADIDDPGHAPRRQLGATRSPPTARIAVSGSTFVGRNQKIVAPNPDRDDLMTRAAVPPDKCAYNPHLRVQFTCLHLAHIGDHDAIRQVRC